MTTIKFNKKSIIIALIFLILGLFIGAGVVSLLERKNIISKNEAEEKVFNFIRQQLPSGITASLVNIVSERGLYKLTIELAEEVGGERAERQINIYLTKDGSLFFPEAINLTTQGEQRVENVEEELNFTQEQLIGLAQCLTDRGVRLFGTYTCPWCVRQRELFGQAAEYLPYVECAPDRATEQELALCQEFGVTSVPDWRFPDGTQQMGMQTVERLAELSGCPL